MANYEIDPDLLKPHLPAGTELDFWEGKCYVSLVGFLFADTRLRGIRVPGHRVFEEVNLRFYVRHRSAGEWRRGVVFIKEIVPLPAITFVANTFYRERYTTMKMDHRWVDGLEDQIIEYRWLFEGEWQHLRVTAERMPVPIAAGSEAEFITEHYWGYTRHTPRKSSEYQVEHPRWRVYPVQKYDIHCRTGDLYGPEFAMLADAAPTSVFVAEGSKVAVYPKRTIRVQEPEQSS